MILATNTSKQRELIPAGNYAARCYQMLHIGTVTEYIMGAPKTLNKVRIGWELPTERRTFKAENGEQPFVISQEYTLSMHEKSNLRKMLASWRGKDFTEKEAESFDITKLLGQPCMINIIHKPSKKDASIVYEQISGITPMPKGMKCPAEENKIQVLSFDDFNTALFDALPDFIKDKIKGSKEYQGMMNPNHIEAANGQLNDADDDLPF